MNREKCIKQYGHLLDKEGAFLKGLDKIDHALKNYESVQTQFCSPDVAFGLNEILSRESTLNWMNWGGYEGSERVKICIAPEYESLDQAQVKLSILELKYQSKFGQIGHKDVLGALMGLGIQRERTGDILVSDGLVILFVDEDLSDYILMSMDKVGRVSVKIRSIDSFDASLFVKLEKTVHDTVKSLRLDAVVAAFYNLSRSEAQKLIESEKVKVNHRPIESTSYEVHQGDLISARGFGRVTLKTVDGVTKKDRIKVTFSSPL